MKKSFSLILFLFCIFILFGTTKLTGCSPKPNITPVTRTGFAFDTVVSVTIYDEKKAYVLDTCFALCEKYEALFSTTFEGSEIWKINHSNGSAVAVSYDTAQLIQSALFYCDVSNGMLDITLRPLSEAWNISGQMNEAAKNPDYKYLVPSAQALSELLVHVNYKNVLLTNENGSVIEYTQLLSNDEQYFVTLKDTQSAIDLGFIAKGFIADCLKAYLLSEGIDSGIISLGGNILLIGSKPDESCFHIGIQKPFASGNEVIATIQNCDGSVVSSGCYERYFLPNKKSSQKNGIIYHHILDTKTGYPIQNDLLGVTILSDSSLQGDALSTYCYMLGLVKGLEFIRSVDNIEAIFITKEFEVITSY